ncbi:Oxidoreductase family, C-terminal alpha/beta domain [Musa troglodytarum]|uniref:Oxidoreductase family, C-terminal alpha/beta domain n=1 Tax=Musa troglodytarum TaxID=320322 RepID=A0A9E7I4E7_9LILI|nr:Oxidoreductase family, C-terminal alpha/beta domain [Musa troglodytarum]
MNGPDSGLTSMPGPVKFHTLDHQVRDSCRGAHPTALRLKHNGRVLFRSVEVLFTTRAAKRTLASEYHIRSELSTTLQERNGGRDSEEQPDPVRHLGVRGNRPQARQCLRPRPLVGFRSRSLDKARRFIALGSCEAVLDDPGVDAVYVHLPTNLHVRWVVGAAERGEHLPLEKPTALCASDLDRILDACRFRGRPRCRSCCPIRPIHSIFSFAGDSDGSHCPPSMSSSRLIYHRSVSWCRSSRGWQEASEILLGSQMTNGQPSLGTASWCQMQ